MNPSKKSAYKIAPRLIKLFLVLLSASMLIALTVWANVAEAATILVTTTADSGAGSLRDAIATATVSDTIEFDASLSNQTIVLSSHITISQDAKIFANVPITLSGGNTTRIFYIEPDGQGVNFEIDGLKLMHAGIITEDGGAIYMEAGLLTVKNSAIYSNTAEDGAGIYVKDGGTVYIYTSTLSTNFASSDGGAVYSTGPLHIKNSQIISNSSDNDAGGIYSYHGIVKLDNTVIYSNTTGSSGGGIYGNYANLLIENNSRIEDNYTGSDGGGIYAYYGSLAIDHSKVLSNTANSEGGGIYADELGVLIENSEVSWNKSEGDSGGMYLDYWSVISNTHVSYNQSDGVGGAIYANYGLHSENSTFEGNDTNDSDGGAIYACDGDSGYVTIVGSIFDDNRGDDGGAIYADVYCGVQIQSSSFISNYASSEGGAIFTYEYNNLVVDRSSFYDNRADDHGGAIYANDDDGTTSILQSTISNNSAGNNGGGLYLNYGGDIQHSTIVSNSAGNDGGGLYLNEPVMIENSIIAGNIVTGMINAPNADCSTNEREKVSSGGHNITGLGTGCMLLDVRDTHIMTGTLFTDVLGPLADNGGATKTHMPLANSPAIDGAPSLTCPKTDQRGEMRGQGSGCDIGSVESSMNGTAPIVAQNIITVTTFDDELNSDSDCSLREAVTAANLNIAVDACPAGKPFSTTVDVIQLAVGTYYLTGTASISTTTDEDSNLADDLDITETVTIRGMGMASTVIDGSERNRIFDVDPDDSDQTGIFLLLEDMKLTNGYDDEDREGGAIYHEAGKLVLNRVDVTNNYSDGEGGAIFAYYGSLYLLNGTKVQKNDNNGDGGGIFGNYAAVNVFDSSIKRNYGSEGGGIYSYMGAVIVDNSTVALNTAGASGGGIYGYYGLVIARNNSLFADNFAEDEDGGAIQNYYAGAWIEDSTFRNNFTVPDDYDGGAINADETSLVVLNSTFEGNRGESGGAIDTQNGGLIINSTFKGNVGGDDGGAIQGYYGLLAIRNSVFENNEVLEYGGAIYTDEASLDVRNTVFKGNKQISPGYYGGAIYTDASNGITLRDTAFIGNRSNGYGGAVYASNNPALIENSTFDSNFARDDAGGVGVEDKAADIFNSTFSNNTAGDEGGGLYLQEGTHINFSTIVNNQAADGAGIHYYGDNYYHHVIQNSIVVGNSLTSRLAGTKANCSKGSGITSNGHNVFEADTGCYETPSDKLIASSDLMTNELYPLADNDGHTLPDGSVIQTHALRATSVAIDGAAETEVKYDQRGTARPQGNSADIGAFEYLNRAPVATDDPDIMMDQGDMVVISPLANDSDIDGDNLMISIVMTPTNGTAVISGTKVTYTPTPQFYGTDSFSYSVSDGVLTDTATVTITVNQTTWNVYLPTMIRP